MLLQPAIETLLLRNTHEVEVEILTLGATISAIRIPTLDDWVDVVLNYDDIQQYQSDPYHLGSVIGRFANRIDRARFTLGGNKVELGANFSKHHIHGGFQGFDQKYWQVISYSQQRVILGYISPDGEEGYPGQLDVRVTYVLTNENELVIEYTATTDKTTIVNLTNHSYFNLAGDNQAVDDHEIQIFASKVTATNADLIPTGELISVEGGTLDFRQLRSLDRSHCLTNERNLISYDHNYIFDDYNGKLQKVAVAYADLTGIQMTVSTTMPGMQFYTAQWLDEPFIANGAFCFETQFFPNSPNIKHFPTPVLRPDQIYQHKTVYEFRF